MDRLGPSCDRPRKYMKILIHRLSILSLIGIILLAQWGCATQAPKLPAELRTQLGRIGVVSAQFTPEPEFEGPGTGFLNRTSGAWEGLKSGAKDGAQKGGSIGFYVLEYTQEYHGGWHPGAILLALASSIVGTTVGTIVGGGVGMTKGTINPGDANALDDLKIMRQTLDAYLKELGMQERFRREVVSYARQNTSQDITELDQEGPTKRDSMVSYQRLKEDDLDTILEVSVVSIGLKSTSAFHPEFSVFMVVKADLLRIEDETLLYRTTLTHTSQSLPYEEWASNNVYAFQRALNDGYRNLAEQIVATLL